VARNTDMLVSFMGLIGNGTYCKIDSCWRILFMRQEMILLM
jgi:hypothetical protein